MDLARLFSLCMVLFTQNQVLGEDNLGFDIDFGMDNIIGNEMDMIASLGENSHHGQLTVYDVIEPNDEGEFLPTDGWKIVGDDDPLLYDQQFLDIILETSERLEEFNNNKLAVIEGKILQIDIKPKYMQENYYSFRWSKFEGYWSRACRIRFNSSFSVQKPKPTQNLSTCQPQLAGHKLQR